MDGAICLELNMMGGVFVLIGIATAYSMLQDELSQELFWLRIKNDIKPDIRIVNKATQISGFSSKYKKAFDSFLPLLEKIRKGGCKLVLFGMGMIGSLYARILEECGYVEVLICCDGKKHGNFDGREVVSPDFLMRDPERYYVLISSVTYYEEIFIELKKRGFPQSRILYDLGKPVFSSDSHIYFDFENCIPQNRTFVDAGCLDGKDTIAFLDRFGEESSVIAFEPDSDNCRKCEKILSGYANVKIIEAAVDAVDRKVSFLSSGNGSSYVLDDSNKREYNFVHSPKEEKMITKINTVAIDNYIDYNIWMIKMDIEGAEMNALLGARDTIKKNKPFLAISVYHRKGDLIEIMEYLHGLVPEYKFWLRNYNLLFTDTVLYASIR